MLVHSATNKSDFVGLYGRHFGFNENLSMSRSRSVSWMKTNPLLGDHESQYHEKTESRHDKDGEYIRNGTCSILYIYRAISRAGVC